MKNLLILLLAITTFTYAKPFHIQGVIIDSQTGQPVPSATVSVPPKNVFYPADGEGKFSIDEISLADTDTLNVSCIGYQTVKMLIRDVAVNGTIRLTPMVNVLNEVKVGYKLTKVGSSLKSAFAKISYLPGMEEAMFMKGSAGHSGIIQSVGFFVSNGGNILYKGRGDFSAPFRIKIYAVDSTGMPGKELTEDIIVASAKKNNQWFDVDVAGYHIDAPDNGFFVAFVLLDATYYKINLGYQNSAGYLASSEGIFTPHLGTSQNEFKEPLMYMLTHTRSGVIKWRKDMLGYNGLIRATIAGN